MISRLEHLSSLTSRSRKFSIFGYSFLMFVLVAFYFAMILKLADSQNLLPSSKIDKEIYIYGFSMFLGVVGSVFIPLAIMLLGFLTKSFSVQWLPSGNPVKKSFLSVLVAGYQEFVLLGVCINIFAFAIYNMGLLGGWFITLNYVLFVSGILIYPLIGIGRLLNLPLGKVVISYSIALMLVFLIGYVFISTR